MLLSRNLDKICRKMLYFLDKTGKITVALGAPPPLASGGWELRLQNPPSCYPLSPVTVTFKEGVCTVALASLLSKRT